MAALLDKTRAPGCSYLVISIRALILIISSLSVLFNDVIQEVVDDLWAWLRSQWVFNSVYFETWFATFCYAVLIPLSFFQTLVKHFDQYRIGKDVVYVDAGVVTILREALIYMTPLMLLDTFMVKRYNWVDPQDLLLRRQNWIQMTRALPVRPPTVFQMTSHLLLSFLIYDAMFYVVHYAMHKNAYLYKYVHALHHEHAHINCRVTNQLTVTERIVLILSANQALKIVGAHPLTRMIFVPLFIAWLIDNHCGYDFPWSIDKVVPFGVVGGPRTHYEHHVNGSRCYQPFFTYIDNYKVTHKMKMR